MNYMLQIRQDGQWVNKQKYTDIWNYRELHDSVAANMRTIIQTSSMGMHVETNVDWRLKRLPDFAESDA